MKANERLSIKGYEKIRHYFTTLTQLWQVGDNHIKFKIAKCFRCIIHSGKDPTLVGESSSENANDSAKLHVNDRLLIQKLFRDSSALECMVNEYSVVASSLDYGIVAKKSLDDGNFPQPTTTVPAAVTFDDELEFYGVPMNKTMDNENGSVIDKELSVVEEGKGDDGSQAIDSEMNSVSIANNSTSKSSAVPKLTRLNSKLMPIDDKTLMRDFSQILLDICLDLSEDPENASIMCSLRLANGIITMIQKDMEFNKRDSRIPLCVELLWNIVESYIDIRKESSHLYPEHFEASACNSGPVMDCEIAVHVLHEVLKVRIHEGFRLSDKELRNEIVIVLSMIAELPDTTPYYIISNVLTTFITYACIEEMGRDSWYYLSTPMANARNFCSVSDIDLEFKKILWLSISNILSTDDADALLCVGSSPLFECMLMYLEFDSLDKKKQDMVEGTSNTMSEEEKSGTMSGTISKTLSGKGLLAAYPLFKMREFQLLAINFLVHNAPKILGEFERIDGPERIVNIAVKYSQSLLAEHKSLVFNCLVLLNRSLISSISVKFFMEESNAMKTFLYLFGVSTEEETRAQSVRLMATLCSTSNVHCQKQLAILNGIPALIEPLAQYAVKRKPIVGLKGGVKFSIMNDQDRLQNPLENPYGGEISILIVAVLDCLTKAVVYNKSNEASFADHEGIDALLDLLEVAPFVLRIQVLRLLSDLLKNPRLVSFANAWRSPKTLRSAGQLLCHCWLDEEVRLDCSRQDGLITDIWNPLGNHKWPIDDRLQLSAANGLLSSSSLNGPGELNSKSMAVTRLATAILAGRNASQCNLPIDVSAQVLHKDTRVIIASTLRSLGVFELYGIRDTNNPFKNTDFNKSQYSPNLDSSASVGSDAKSPTRSIGNIASQQSTSKAEPSTEYSEYEGESSPIDQRRIGSNNAKLANTYDSSASELPAMKSSGDLGLVCADRQVLSLAKKYDVLREGEWWKAVKEETELMGIVAVEADINLIDAQMEYCFDAAQAVQIEQMNLADEDLRLRKGEEGQFINQIIFKKNQQIKSEWLKKNGKNRSAINPHTRKKF